MQRLRQRGHKGLAGKIDAVDRRTRLIGLGGLIAVLLLLGYLRGGGKSTGFITAQVRRGDLVAAIGATGTVEPEQVVDVGA